MHVTMTLKVTRIFACLNFHHFPQIKATAPIPTFNSDQPRLCFRIIKGFQLGDKYR